MAEIAHLTHYESRVYEENLKQYRDMSNTIATAKREGRESRIEGRKAAKYEDALKMKELGSTVVFIVLGYRAESRRNQRAEDVM